MDYKMLNLLFRFSKEFSHGKIRAQELNDTECMICSYVYSNDGCSQDNVVNALRIDKSTLGKAVTALEQKGCLLRELDAVDRRKKRLHLSNEGKERISKLLDVHNDWMDRILTCLSEEEQFQFEQLCVRLLSAAERLSQNIGIKEGSKDIPF